MEQDKTIAQTLAEKLLYTRKNSGISMDDTTHDTANQFCENYKNFLDQCKTERESVTHIISVVQNKGYTQFQPNKKYQAGDKVYFNNRGKALILVNFGKKSLDNGIRIIASHIDCPKLDLKPNPLYEEAQLAMFKTHYYGGVKKYQWTAIPLALHGVIVKKDGQTITVKIGEDPTDPIFAITDLLPHLAQDQMKRTLKDGIKGEELNVLIGCRPFRDDKQSERIKLNIMRLLNEKYDIVEADFQSAELTMVPAFSARDIGFDRSMIGAYGHDDRVCAYTSLMAALDCDVPEQTFITIFSDKEETGSNGNTGLHSHFMSYFVEEMARPHGIEVSRVLSNSTCLSADVSAAFDPTFSDVYEKRNTSYINHGVVITQYTGSGGKGGTSEASAEFMASVRRTLDDADVAWQTGELGKVDQGGGGTVAMYVAAFNVDVVDIGVPVLSMHAPMEIVSKLDVYSTYQAFCAYVSAK